MKQRYYHLGMFTLLDWPLMEIEAFKVFLCIYVQNNNINNLKGKYVLNKNAIFNKNNLTLLAPNLALYF